MKGCSDSECVLKVMVNIQKTRVAPYFWNCVINDIRVSDV